MADIGRDAADDFIHKWQGVAASELSTSQSFLADLCRLLGVDTPHPTPGQDYMFERPITFTHGDGSTSAGRIDLYRRGAFVLESKKLKAGTHTKGFDDAMLRARSQAEGYARALPASEGRPPFVVVVDVGHRIELYSEFTRSGATYTPFPDPRSHRIALDDLRRPDIRERLRKLWLDPLALDPSRESARVTREIAAQLAELAKSLEKSGYPAEAVAQFLMRCLFTMFAEDVRLLPENSFRDLLVKHEAQPDIAMRMLGQLWRDMDAGGFSAAIANDVLKFNGKLFKQPDTLPLDKDQLALLIRAAKADWKHVEPAIFGTLLERALEPGERHKLGAHYTPRAYVERLVLPTVIEPLRSEWSDAQAAALTLAAEGKHDEAVAELLRFHHRLCNVRVLDPACGSGNFLYVTLEHLKRLEGEVLGALDDLGHRQTGLALSGERADATAGETVDPHNLLGIELNPRAAAIAEVVLWIGYLQWHFRTRDDVNPPIPVIRDFRNIENRDAVLAYDRVEYVTDERGVPVTRWDGRTMKKSPVTGEDIPDEAARVPVQRYVNPRKAAWPVADFVVGNPPFIGNKRMRTALGDGYVEALRGAWPEMPESADFVMYWWHYAAEKIRRGGLQRFGLITTNSISQTFNRRVIERAMADSGDGKPVSLAFAIPDHPWVDVAEGAAVRIAMTVADASAAISVLREVVDEQQCEREASSVTLRERRGRMFADLKIGANVAGAVALEANRFLSNQGMTPLGTGFRLTPEAAKDRIAHNPESEKVIRPYAIGRDIVQRYEDKYIIDLFGLDEAAVRNRFPDLYQHLLLNVKPEREEKKRDSYRLNWWIFAEARANLRQVLLTLPRYIATCRTARHRIFTFLQGEVLPDAKIVAIGLDDWYHLGVVSSVIHVAWSDAAGARMGVGNDLNYNHSECFGKFPFPSPASEGHGRIRQTAEELELHRKRQQTQHPDLTLTGMYNVLDKLRGGEQLTPKERLIHQHGLVSVLRQLHDDLDAAVLDAYGWSDLLPLLRIAHGNDPPTEGQTREEVKRAFDEAILERLVALNAERAAEESRGLIRWLRPDFQNPQSSAAETPTPEQGAFDTDVEEAEPATAVPAAIKPQPWPKNTIEQVRAVAEVLATAPTPLSVDEVASRFTGRGPWKKRLPQLLEMLVALGRASVQEGGCYSTRQ